MTISCRSVETTNLTQVDVQAAPSSGNPSLNKPNLSGLTREQKERLILIEKRRRQVKRAKSACKRFVSFLFSQIGLSSLVIAYTFLGGVIFMKIESENEKNTKIRALQMMDATKNTLIITFEDELLRHFKTENDAVKFIEIFKMFKNTSLVVKPDETESTENNTTSIIVEENINKLNEAQENMINEYRDRLNTSIKEVIKMWTKQVKDLIENDGWAASDDLKWSIEGSILFAITVITTIGYGYTAPRTTEGRFLTIIYALVGLPLVFLYLSNIGDYLADIFRILYTRTCQKPCEKFCSPTGYSTLYRKAMLIKTKGWPDGPELFDDIGDSVSEAGNHGLRNIRRRVLLQKIGDKSCDVQRNALLKQMIEEGLIEKIDDEVKILSTDVIEKDYDQILNELPEDEIQPLLNNKSTDLENATTYQSSLKSENTSKNIILKLFSSKRKINRGFNTVNNSLIRLISNNANAIKSIISPYVSNLRERIICGLDSFYPGLIDFNEKIPEHQATVEQAPEAITMTVENSPTKKSTKDEKIENQVSISTMPLEVSSKSIPPAYLNLPNSEYMFTLNSNPVYQCSPSIMNCSNSLIRVGNVDSYHENQNLLFTSPPVEYDAKGHRKYHGVTKLYRSAEHEENHRKRKKQCEKAKLRKKENFFKELHSRYPVDDSIEGNEAFMNEECSFVSWKDIDQALEITSLDEDRYSKASIETLNLLGLEYSYNYEVNSNPDKDSGCDLNKRGSYLRQSISYKNVKRASEMNILTEPVMPFRRCSELSNNSRNRNQNPILETSALTPYHHDPFCFDMNGARIKSSTLPIPLIRQLRDLPSYKSRASLLSSIGADSPSDIYVRFSYFSKSSKNTPSDKMSFFTFDQFGNLSFISTIDYKGVTVPISLSLTIMTAYILLGAFLFSIWEDYDVVKWFYFCFVTLSSIGFGDVMPGTKVETKNQGEKLVMASIYVAIGLSVFAMCIKLMQEEVVAKLKWLADRISAITKKENEE